MTPVPKPRLWPRDAIGPLGNRATFHCMGDVPHGWVLEHPLPDRAAMDLEKIGRAVDEMEAATKAKNKGGRPRKVAP